jgi:hypothetical protein
VPCGQQFWQTVLANLNELFTASWHVFTKTRGGNTA